MGGFEAQGEFEPAVETSRKLQAAAAHQAGVALDHHLRPPSQARDGEYTVRITVQRVIYDKMDRVKVMERIDTAETYQMIFDNLRKSLFIQESHT